MTDSFKNNVPIPLGPASRYFLAAGVFSPWMFLATVLALFTILPFTGIEGPKFSYEISKFIWQNNIQVVAPLLMVLNILVVYLKMATTLYSIDEGCLRFKSITLQGIAIESMTLSLVVDCNVAPSWGNSLLGLGVLHIRSADQNENDMFLYGIPNVENVRHMILEHTNCSSGRVLGTV